MAWKKIAADDLIVLVTTIILNKTIFISKMPNLFLDHSPDCSRCFGRHPFSSASFSGEKDSAKSGTRAKRTDTVNSSKKRNYND